MPLPIAKAAVEEAHHHHLPVFSHTQNFAGLEVAIDSGVDVIAHTVEQSPPWTPELCARLTSRHMALIPTLMLFDIEVRKAHAPDKDRLDLLARLENEVRVFSHAGGEILFGTDVGYTDVFDTTEEFQFMSAAGLTFDQILASLTTNPAGRFRPAEQTAQVAPHMNADLVVLDADPAADPQNFSRVRYTVARGRVIYDSQSASSKPAR